ncbi:TetR/AcrR family transcriptional regulator [Falsibacillus albus]|uniref:TetR/AcrR family transcriptional regulator n=1 Tax=Falsibacillus albus TaxID=2478915 RepID=UPI0013140C20|nr:TetR/AcrR family transcriptional regulator [Falsibacillus albus]
MIGIRKKKKQETKNRILKSAKKLFFENGYDYTTTEEIAREAEVASGTIFNYFDSKAEILIEAFADDFMEEMDQHEFQLDQQDLQKAAADLIYDFIDNRIKRYSNISKKIMRQLFSSSFTAFKSKPELLKKMIDLDFMFVDELIVYINEMKARRLLPETFQSNEAAEIIYSILAFEYIIYIFQKDRTLTELMDGIRNKVNFIIKD